MARLLAHANQRIPSLRESRPDVLETIQQVFEKMVAKEADRRFQSMTEVIAALEQTRGEGALTAIDLGGLSGASVTSSQSSGQPDVFVPDGRSSAGDDRVAATVALPTTGTEDATVITSSLSDTLQSSQSEMHGQARSRSARLAWWSDKRVLVGAGIVLLMLRRIAI